MKRLESLPRFPYENHENAFGKFVTMSGKAHVFFLWFQGSKVTLG